MSAFVALLATALFAGAALYVSLAEHPSRFHLPVSAAVTQFRHSYARASVMQALLSAIGFVAGLVAMIEGHGILWAVGGLLVSAPIPFTLIVIMPTNRQLKSDPLSDTDAVQLMRKWGRLHWARTAMGLAGLATMIVAAIF